MVVGGSQGAKIFDNVVKNVIVNLSKKNKIKIIQQTHKSNTDQLRSIYDEAKIENTIFDFEENLADLINQSDLCITRAGASTLAELSIMNKPFLTIPLVSAKDNHQFENANFYQNLGCCWIMNQKDFNDVNLEKFLNHKETFCLHFLRCSVRRLNICHFQKNYYTCRPYHFGKPF